MVKSRATSVIGGETLVNRKSYLESEKGEVESKRAQPPQYEESTVDGCTTTPLVGTFCLHEKQLVHEVPCNRD